MHRRHCLRWSPVRGCAAVPGRAVETLESRRLLAAADLFTTLPGISANINIQFDEAAQLGSVPGLILTGHRNSDPESLYVTDGAGTNATPLLTATTFSGTPNIGITALTPFNGKVYFFANTFTNNQLRDALFVTDGTVGGTQEVKLLRSGGANVLPTKTFVLNNRLHYLFGGSLWSSDGTTAGTSIVAAAPEAMTMSPVVDGKVFFGTAGQVWRTDGTAAGTVQVWVDPNNPSHTPSDFVFAGGKLFFRTLSSNASSGRMYVADANGAGVQKLTIPVQNPAFEAYATRPLAVGDRVVFIAPEPQSSMQRLFATDGTATGMVQLAGGMVGTTSNEVFTPASVAPDKAVFFYRSQNSTLSGLWVTDGTVSGTQRIVARSQTDSQKSPLFTIPGRVFYNESAFGGGVRLLSTDGTTAGTRAIHYLAPGLAFTGSSGPFVATVGPRAVLHGSRAGIPELWSFDPSVPTASISGIGYFDENRNGVKEGFEPHLTGTVYIDLNNNGQLDSGEANRSASDGNTYLFDGLPAPQQYVLRFLPYGIYSDRVITSPAGGAQVIELQPCLCFRVMRLSWRGRSAP